MYYFGTRVVYDKRLNQCTIIITPLNNPSRFLWSFFKPPLGRPRLHTRAYFFKNNSVPTSAAVTYRLVRPSGRPVMLSAYARISLGHRMEPRGRLRYLWCRCVWHLLHEMKSYCQKICWPTMFLAGDAKASLYSVTLKCDMIDFAHCYSQIGQHQSMHRRCPGPKKRATNKLPQTPSSGKVGNRAGNGSYIQSMMRYTSWHDRDILN